MNNVLQDLLEWDKAGPVAILMFMLFALTWTARWLLAQLLADKRAQIERLEHINDRVTDEMAATLKQILDALRDREARR